MQSDREYNDPIKPKVKKRFFIEYRLTDEAIERFKNLDSDVFRNIYRDQMNKEWKIFSRYKSQKALDEGFKNLINKQKSPIMIGERVHYNYHNYIFRKSS